MKRPGAIYKGVNGRQYLVIYNFHHDIATLLPPDFRSAERVAAFSYSKDQKKGGFDVFLLNDSLPLASKITSIRKTFSRSNGEYRVVHEDGRVAALPETKKEAEEAYDIRSQIVSSFPEEIRAEVLGFSEADIAYYCGEEVAKKRRGSLNEVVSRIIPVTELKRYIPKKILEGGKAEFVPQCFLEANIDFMDGCITSWIPGQDASFDGQFFRDYWQFIWGDCEYCYAGPKHRAFPKSFREINQEQLLEELRGAAKLIYGSQEILGRPVEILRFGKRTDPWTPFTEENFIGTLEAMTQTGTKGVITTKFLPFDIRFAELLRNTHSTLLYSIGGSEDVELGTLEWGCNNEFRLEQAAKYREAKVNAAFFYLMHPSFPPTSEDIKRLEFAEAHNIPIQFIPARFYTKEAAQRVIAPLVGLEDTDIPLWEILKDDSPDQTGFVPNYWFANTYEMDARNLVPKLERMHDFWAKRIGRNQGKRARMCAHDSKTTFCGGCFTKPGTISPTHHNLVKLTRITGTGNTRKKLVDPRQIPLNVIQ